ncbi:hypothetical protein RHSIM_Rhsim01G0142000 [Rhododendron simsii]|uniref:Transposase MuDR plant domain-containing protein n=1 Tax=Rhododendron simsii TaxID=118357 RepID=A0A834HHB4_RHOSS|nr:hypothetical protein RHSIM_Rhsim01G0142000 [Rhododendron simsii]
MTDQGFVFEVHNGAKVDFVRDVDKDLISYFEMVHMIKDLGYSEKCNIYHKLPDCDLDGGLRDIKTDGDVMDMFAIHNDKKTISIYVVNPVVEEGQDGDELESGHISTKLESETFMGHSELVTLREGEWNGSGNGCNYSYGEGTSHGKGKEVEFDDMDNPNNSLDEEGKVEFTEFFEDRDMERPDLELGMIFANATLFRAALRKHTIQNGTEFTFVKNDGDRVTAVCSNGCGWRVHASYFQDTKSFQIKSLVNHPCSCPRQYRLRHANSAWLARTYMDRLIDDPNWKVSALRKAAKREHMVEMQMMSTTYGNELPRPNPTAASVTISFLTSCSYVILLEIVLKCDLKQFHWWQLLKLHYYYGSVRIHMAQVAVAIVIADGGSISCCSLLQIAPF